MSSITTWQRLELMPRAADILESLRAEIADPLWMLARQRQFGELAGEDAGSPIQAQFEASSARIGRVLRGVAGADAATKAIDHDDRVLPLETVVEREALRSTPQGGGLAVTAGLHFLRLLRAGNAAGAVRAYVDHYALTADDLPGGDADTARLRRRATGRVPDGRRLRADLLAARGNDAQLTTLPAQPAVAASNRAKVLAAANAFLAWWDGFLSEPGADEGDPWNPRRLEHSFAVEAATAGGPVVLRTDDYRGGRLDWYSFVATDKPALGDAAALPDATRVVRTLLPAPATYAGMPTSRFWEIEDGTVRFGALTTGRTDLARLLLAEFALTYGNDWFVVPVDLAVGSVCAVGGFTVTDTFGEATDVARSADADGASFRLFEIDAPNGPARVERLFFLAPVVAQCAESEPVEEVGFLRDEMANVVWGVERRYQGGAGTPVDRYEEHQRRLAAAQHIDVDFGDAQLLYRLATDVPYHWFPFVPVAAEGVAPTPGVIQLERRPLIRFLPDGTQIVPEPDGRILTAADPLRLEEEEVPRAGTDVVRTFQLARWTDGRYVCWSSRHRLVGRGEGSSGLRFDSVGPPPT